MSKRLKRLILALTLFLSIFITVPVKANPINSYKLKESSVIYQQKRVLIYHTHSREEYIDSNVIEMGKDLSDKLSKMGYTVTHVTDDFSVDYNTAYDKSREYLLGINTEDFDLIIDYHRDSLNFKNTISKNNVDVAKAMFVYSQNSGNYNTLKGIGDKIKSDVFRNDYEYEYGINYFNSDLDDNILLLESGNVKNNKWEIKRLNTYLAKSIGDYLKMN